MSEWIFGGEWEDCARDKRIKSEGTDYMDKEFLPPSDSDSENEILNQFNDLVSTLHTILLPCAD